MIHTLPYQSEELLRSSYFKVRNKMNVQSDVIHLFVTHSHIADISTEEAYKKVLSLDGKYREEYNLWTAPMAKVRVIHQL